MPKTSSILAASRILFLEARTRKRINVKPNKRMKVTSATITSLISILRPKFHRAIHQQKATNARVNSGPPSLHGFESHPTSARRPTAARRVGLILLSEICFYPIRFTSAAIKEEMRSLTDLGSSQMTAESLPHIPKTAKIRRAIAAAPKSGVQGLP